MFQASVNARQNLCRTCHRSRSRVETICTQSDLEPKMSELRPQSQQLPFICQTTSRTEPRSHLLKETEEGSPSKCLATLSKWFRDLIGTGQRKAAESHFPSRWLTQDSQHCPHCPYCAWVWPPALPFMWDQELPTKLPTAATEQKQRAKEMKKQRGL